MALTSIQVNMEEDLRDLINRAVDSENARKKTRINRNAWAERVLGDAARRELNPTTVTIAGEEVPRD